jgi:hypothetical protein
MRILALDLGSVTGWAVYDSEAAYPPAYPLSGSDRLVPEKVLREVRKQKLIRCCDPRFSKLHSFVESFLPLDCIYFEDVQFLTSQAQAQLWAGFRGVLTLFAFKDPAISLRDVPVGTLKKFATGKGNATKDQMGEALCSKIPSLFGCYVSSTTKGVTLTFKHKSSEIPMDDNEVDAIHLLRYALCKMQIKSPLNP